MKPMEREREKELYSCWYEADTKMRSSVDSVSLGSVFVNASTLNLINGSHYSVAMECVNTCTALYLSENSAPKAL